MKNNLYHFSKHVVNSTVDDIKISDLKSEQFFTLFPRLISSNIQIEINYRQCYLVMRTRKKKKF